MKTIVLQMIPIFPKHPKHLFYVMDGKTIIYQTYESIYEATYARDTLKENCIESFIASDSTLPSTLSIFNENYGIRLYIFEKDRDRVSDILDNSSTSERNF